MRRSDIFIDYTLFQCIYTLVNLLMLTKLFFGGNFFFFLRKKPTKLTKAKAPTLSWFCDFSKISCGANPYPVAASKSISFPLIYTALHNDFIMKVCLTLTWIVQDLTTNRRSFCYPCKSILFQSSSKHLLSA